jgi:hypothetical protein
MYILPVSHHAAILISVHFPITMPDSTLAHRACPAFAASESLIALIA